MRNVLDKHGENQNTHPVFKNLAIYEIISKNVVEPEGPHMTSQYGTYELHAG